MILDYFSKLLTKIVRPLKAVILLPFIFSGSCDEAKPSDNLVKNYSHWDGPWITFNQCDGTAVSININFIQGVKSQATIHFGETDPPLDSFTSPEDSFFHSFPFDNLVPGQQYFYSVDFPDGIVSDSFTAPNCSNSIKFAVLGDMQPNSEITMASAILMAEAIESENPDFFIQLGDLVYRGTDADFWHDSLTALKISAGAVPLRAVCGNHDKQYDGGNNWRMMMPHDWNPAGLEKQCYYYTDTVNNVRFIFMDTTCEDNGPGSDQILWLEEVLASNTSQWTFVFLHDSLLSSGMENIPWHNTSVLIPIFDRYGVDGVFYGHDHMYEHYEFTYGSNGFIFDPDHIWEHNPVHYWLTGGGGAALESEWGIARRDTFSYSRSLFEAATGLEVKREYTTRPWNPDNFITNAPADFSPSSPVYFHDPDVELYQDESGFFGLDYGVNSLHYIMVEVDGDTCTVTVKYPDGTTVSAPENRRIQTWTLTK